MTRASGTGQNLRMSRNSRELDPGEQRDAEATGALLVIGVAVIVVGAVVAARGYPVAALYVVAALFGGAALVVLVHPEFGTHPDVSRRTVVLLCAPVGFGVVGLLLHLLLGPGLSLLFAVLGGLPLGAAVGWLLGTALVALVRGLRRLVRSTRS